MLMAILLLVLTNLKNTQNKIIASFNSQCAICIDAVEHLANLGVIFNEIV